MKILLLCSSFNGLTQRVWVELRRAGHDVTWQQAVDDGAVRLAVDALDPELIVCPFLRERVPDDVWRARPTVIIHPGPVGDRGPSSLDWAITEAAPEWGSRFRAEHAPPPGAACAAVPAPRRAAPRKSVVCRTGHRHRRRAGPRGGREGLPTGFMPDPVDDHGALPVGGAAGHVPGRSSLLWTDPTADIVRRIRPATAPGVRTELAGMEVSVFDAHPGTALLDGHGAAEPGSVVLRRHGAVLVRTGDGAVWIGQARPVSRGSRTTDQAAGGGNAGRPRRGRARGAGPRDRHGGVGRSRIAAPVTSAS